MNTTPETVRRSPRREATRQRLLDAAVELFGERGVLGSSVEEICERAGFTRGAFYSNFESKDELCLDVLRRKGEQYLSAMQAAIAVIPDVPGPAGGGTEGLIRDAVGVFLEAQPKKPAELVSMMELRLHALRTPELREGWLAVHEGISKSTSGLLDVALDRVGARLSVPSSQVIELLGAVYENTVSLSLLRGESRPADLAEQLAALLDAFIVGDC
ncbi:MAG: TetR/AcrR family transcriptional regulator [Micropruina sp.]|uniref:TetR/AcrR family transcriptional regulator n=1 Tax=Micropruina sp. TaxID=2737536 RepID=UPI0039E263C5